MDIPADDLKIDVYPIPGIHSRGGQHVGINPGVRVTHIPTGIMAYVHCERSQRLNREIAIDMLLSAITHPKFRG